MTGDRMPEAGSAPPPSADPAIPDAPEPADPPPVPADSDDTRGHHLRRLVRHPATLGIGGILAVIGFAVGTTVAGVAIGAAAAAAVALLALLVIWLLASGKAREDFFRAYAKGRGLTQIDGKTDLPPLTPLVRKGDRRYAEQRFSGVLPGGLDGSLCLYTYEEETRDSDGNRQTTYVHFTVVITQLPETAAFLDELYCQRRFGFRFMDSMEDVFRKRQRVEHESEAVDKEFEIFTGENDDLNRARQVLSPTFLVWLESHSPEAYAFELVDGSLVCNVKGHKKAASELDAICAASAAVARRLQDEATEVGRSGAAPGSRTPPASN